jgi:GT2 family glycosyltransferase/glycosyltransferase involved in cell wall biosynthesis
MRSMPPATLRTALARLLTRLVFGTRSLVLQRPMARAVLRLAGRPMIGLMHRLAGPAAPVVAPGDHGLQPVLRLPLDHDLGPLPPGRSLSIFAAVEAPAEAERLLAAAGRCGLPVRLRLAVPGDRLAAVQATAGADSAEVEVRAAPPGLGGLLTAFPELADEAGPVLISLGSEGAAATEGLLASIPVIRGALEALDRTPTLGVLAPPRPSQPGWGALFGACRRAADELGFALFADSPSENAGCAFWAKPAALAPLGRLARAGHPEDILRRLVFHAAESAGLRWARAGSEAGAGERLWRAYTPRDLQRIVTDQGRALLLPGRPPWTPSLGADGKARFRDLCRQELEAFLAAGDRLVLPTSDAPEVTVVLVLFNQAELTLQALRALRHALDRPAEVVLVDNASSDRTGELLDRLDGARILRNGGNLHFLRAVNQAAAVARGDKLLLLNNDARLRPGSIAAAARRLDEEPDLGAVGGRIDLLDGALQEAGSIVWSDGSAAGYGRGGDPWSGEFQFRRDVDYVSGAFLMTPRPVFERLGGFDTAFAPAYYEETDYCLRLWSAGLRVAYEPGVVLSHFEFGSAGQTAALALQEEHRKVLLQKHAAALRAQPAPGSPPLLARMRRRHAGRILILEDQTPYPHLGAGYPRALDLLRAAHDAGWFVTFFPTLASDVDYTAAYDLIPRDVEFAAELGQARLVEFMRARAGAYDAVLVSRPHNMAAFRAALTKVPGFISSERVIYDAEAIFAARGPSDPAAVARELALAQGAGAVLAVSEAEAEAFRQAGCRQVAVLGHALQADPGPAELASRRGLLFVGALDEDGSPNADSLAFFVREVAPRLDALIGSDWRLRVAGRSAAPGVRALASDRVELLGPVADLAPLYRAARVFVAPTRFAAGIPMKVHQAAAAGLPVAATPLLAGQLGWADGEALAVGEGAEGFAAAVARLYQDEGLWLRVREGALARISAECDPAAFRETVARVLAPLAR